MLAGCGSGCGGDATQNATWQKLSPSQGKVEIYHTSPDLSNPGIVPQNEVFELTVEGRFDHGKKSNLDDVTLSVDFRDPVSARVVHIEGFYYQTRHNGTSLWKARFTTNVVGTWSYVYTFTDGARNTVNTGGGKFRCVPGPNLGFMRINRANPFRWVLDNGRPFVPLGLNWAGPYVDGGDVNSAFGGWRVAMFEREEQLSVMRDSGFNMMRFKGLTRYDGLVDQSGTRYFPDTWIRFDERMRILRKLGFRVFYGILGNRFQKHQPLRPPLTDAHKLLIKRSIARWGAYVDVWQLQNEAVTDGDWVSEATRYIKNNDPYNHPVTGGWFSSGQWGTPGNSEIDLMAPHWYTDENELESGQLTATKAVIYKTHNKPVFFGEQGNGSRNWSAESARRMRIRAWSALFNEISLFFFPWDASTSFHTGIWIGPRERQFMQIMQRFAETVIRPNSVMMEATVSNPSKIRVYGISSDDNVGLYIHHSADHSQTLSGETVTFTSPATGLGYWIDPVTGRVLETVAIAIGENTLAVPSFAIDVAFLSANGPLNVSPIAVIDHASSQWSDSRVDLDGDGKAEGHPFGMPFGEAPLTIHFDAARSSDWDGDPLTFTWDFGDGEAGAGPRTSHTYGKGSFLARLTITDASGRRTTQGFAVRATSDNNPDANDAPVWLRIPGKTVRAGNIATVGDGHLLALDKELYRGKYRDDPLSVTVKNLPSGARFLKLSQPRGKVPLFERFWWIPEFDQTGKFTVEFDVRDKQSTSAVRQSFTVTVVPAEKAMDDAPEAVSDAPARNLRH